MSAEYYQKRARAWKQYAKRERMLTENRIDDLIDQINAMWSLKWTERMSTQYARFKAECGRGHLEMSEKLWIAWVRRIRAVDRLERMKELKAPEVILAEMEKGVVSAQMHWGLEYTLAPRKPRAKKEAKNG